MIHDVTDFQSRLADVACDQSGTIRLDQMAFGDDAELAVDFGE